MKSLFYVLKFVKSFILFLLQNKRSQTMTAVIWVRQVSRKSVFFFVQNIGSDSVAKFKELAKRTEAIGGHWKPFLKFVLDK